MKNLIIFLALFATAAASWAGWTVYDYPDFSAHPGMVSLDYSTNRSEGYANFGDAFKQLQRRGAAQRLKTVIIHEFLRETDYQKELFSVLERSAPKALHEALRSSGNMHNPKMDQLYRPFMEAVLLTPRVRKIAAELGTQHLKVTHASGDKFMLFREGGKRRFYCGLVLGIDRIAEPNGAANGSQPVRSGTNTTSSAAGSRR